MQILKISAILIYFYFILVNSYYRVVLDLTNVLYINRIINVFGNFILLIPIGIIFLNIYNIYLHPLRKTMGEKQKEKYINYSWKRTSNVMTLLAYIMLFAITFNDFLGNEVTNFILVKIFHPTTLNFKKELYMASYNHLADINQFKPLREVSETIVNQLQTTSTLETIIDLSIHEVKEDNPILIEPKVPRFLLYTYVGAPFIKYVCSPLNTYIFSYAANGTNYVFGHTVQPCLSLIGSYLVTPYEYVRNSSNIIFNMISVTPFWFSVPIITEKVAIVTAFLENTAPIVKMLPLCTKYVLPVVTPIYKIFLFIFTGV